MRRRLIAGNWKMNAPADPIGFVDEVARARGAQEDVGALICPPATLIHALVGRGLRIGAQNCHADISGAHTGDLSAEMLASAGAGHVIVGHSERRAAYGESDADVRAKAAAAHRASLTAIICVGETAAERGEDRALDVASAQLAAGMPDTATAANTVIAYEPVWAIGTGRTASIDEIGQVHAKLRAMIAEARSGFEPALLYGGSVKPANAADIMALPDVDGVLVGGASLDAENFWSIYTSGGGA